MRAFRSSALALLAVVVLVGCGGADEPAVTTAADGTVTASLSLKSGGETWVVTLPEGSTEAYDLYGNDGRKPVAIWQEGPIEMPLGALFAIGLEAPVGSDATWRATGGTADGTVLELVQQGVNPYDATTPDAELGVHYFVFRGTAEGSGTLEFGRFAPVSEAPDETTTFDVVITAGE